MHDLILYSDQLIYTQMQQAITEWLIGLAPKSDAHVLFSALPIMSFVTLLSTFLCVNYFTHPYLIIIK